MGNTKLQYAVRAVLAAAAASAVAPAYAQTAPAAASDTALQEVVVTGSRLAISPNDVSISPITSLDSLDIQKSGLVRTEDLLNNLPQVVAEQSGGTSISSNGTATVSLRGLGSQRTLVLVNGTRLAPGAGLGTTTTSSADINQIPADLIERVEVLTGGASSVYGADAVAGVVNFVLNTHFEGVRIDSNYGFGRYQNDHADLIANLVAKGDPVPDSTVDAGFNKDVSILMGSNFADGKGNATVYATYLKTSPAVGYQYDYAGCSLNTPSTLPGPGGLSCGGSGTPATGRFAVYGLIGGSIKPATPASSYAVDPSTGAFRPYSNATDSYNYGGLSFLQRAAERYTAGSFLNYDINDNTTMYSDFMYARNSSEANYGPSGLFTYTAATISCGGAAGVNPLLSAQEVSILCAPGVIAANQAAFPQNAGTSNINLYVGRRAVENGPREDNYLSNSFRETLGVKGKWIEGLSYDLYGQVGLNTMHDSQGNYINATSGTNALNVVTDPATGLPACAAALNGGPAPTCVPWNIFAKGGVTPAAIAYIDVPATYSVTVKEYIVDGSVTADLEKMGMKLPTASSGPSINLGAEYRSESYILDPDYIFANGLNSGGNGAQSAINGGFHVSEVFTEARLPIFNDLPAAYDLSLEAGYRYSSYTSGFNTNTYKFGVEYAPIKDVKLRGGYNRAVRAPSVGDLFAPAVIGAGGTADPCWGPVVGAVAGNPTSGTIQGHDFAYCARTGVTQAEWGNIATNPAAQINTSVGGNIDLKPEIADTFTYGFVFQPTFVPNLVASLDFYYIRIQNTIESLTSNTIVNNCGQNDSGCDLIHRGAGTGSLWFNNSDYVTATEQNIGTISTKGIDLASHYSFDTGYGKLGFQLLGTRVLNSFTAPIAGGAAYNCAGYWGTTCNAPTPHWRHVLNTDWQAPWLGLDLSLRWRYIGPTQSDHVSQDPQLSSTYYTGTAHIGGYSYLDMSLSMPIASTGIDVRVGVNNITDKAPPIIPSGSYSECPNTSCNDNTWVGTYDTLGRYLYAHVQVKF
ncbi:MAG TPA: TonB-dependent receptor [Steroidobacteraceae bacterium]